MVVALSTAREVGLAAVAGAFILFALLAAFVLPARDHNFPGRRLPLFLAVTVLFFVAMIAAVLVLAREPEEEAGHEAGPAETQTQTETGGGTQTEPPPPAAGDAAAGEEVFASAGCGSCHTLEAAGSSGTIGPNLDDLAPALDATVEQVTNGGGGMPPFGGQLSETQIQDVAAFVFESTH